MGTHWEIEEGRVDSAHFFDVIWTHFPLATTFYAEGTSIAREVKDCYLRNAEEGPYRPTAETLLPRSARFRCRFSQSLTSELSSLAHRHAEPELLGPFSPGDCCARLRGTFGSLVQQWTGRLTSRLSGPARTSGAAACPLGSREGCALMTGTRP
jgi:hypothetical protein